MSKYKKRAFFIILAELLLIAGMNLFLHKSQNGDKPHLVEIKRAAAAMQTTDEIPEITNYKYITAIRKFAPDDYDSSDYRVEAVNGTLYRFNYEAAPGNTMLLRFNLCAGILALISAGILVYFYFSLIRPFHNMQELTKELAKGNLSTPVKAEKSRYFGDFLWGMDMLREKLENDKVREMELLKDRKALILSLTHDIKTPLAAMDLYVRALLENLYEEDRKEELYNGIEKNLVEIQNYVNSITKASREDAIEISVRKGEFYLSGVLDIIENYYKEKMALHHIDFSIAPCSDCLLSGDEDRTVEVMQNVIENAVKYGDGRFIHLDVREEEDCKLINITNSGDSLSDDELLHIFDSFYRGSNSSNIKGSGMGLYICKKILHQMDGEIFTEKIQNGFQITVVLRKV